MTEEPVANEGILFTALGKEFIAEAATAARRIQELGNDYPIAIIADQEPTQDCFDETIVVDIGPEDRQHFLKVRLENLDRSPFSKTVYFDTDTWVIDGDAVDDLFAVLENFDVITTSEFGRRLDIYRPESPDELANVKAPEGFPMFHAGVFGFKDNKNVSKFISAWNEAFERHTQEMPNLQNDQPAFRESLYNTDVQIGWFAPEYCFRLPFPQQVIGRVKIIHGRASNFKEITAKLNRRTGRRMCYPIHTSTGPPDGRDVDILINPGLVKRGYRMFKQSIRDYGLLKTVAFTLAGGPVQGRKRLRSRQSSDTEAK